MTDYIKIPTFPTQDLLRGIEAVSPYPRINPHQPRQEGYAQRNNHHEEEKEERSQRRFIALRRLIEKLKESARIDRVDFASADGELHDFGLAIIEEQLLQQLLQLKIPLDSIEQLLQQIDQNRSNLGLGPGRQITSDEATLFPVSAKGLAEYNLKIEELKIRTGSYDNRIGKEIDANGHCIVEENRLRLTFSRLGPALDAASELLKLKISVLLGVIEIDEEGRRALLYPRSAGNYALYSDKLISLSI